MSIKKFGMLIKEWNIALQRGMPTKPTKNLFSIQHETKGLKKNWEMRGVRIKKRKKI